MPKENSIGEPTMSIEVTSVCRNEKYDSVYLFVIYFVSIFDCLFCFKSMITSLPRTNILLACSDEILVLMLI